MYLERSYVPSASSLTPIEHHDRKAQSRNKKNVGCSRSKNRHGNHYRFDVGADLFAPMFPEPFPLILADFTDDPDLVFCPDGSSISEADRLEAVEVEVALFVLAFLVETVDAEVGVKVERAGTIAAETLGAAAFFSTVLEFAIDSPGAGQSPLMAFGPDFSVDFDGLAAASPSASSIEVAS